MSILERMQEAVAAEAAFVPVHGVFGLRTVGAQHGRVTLRQDVGPLLLDRDGRICPGSLLVGIDGALGGAIATTLPEDQTLTTLSIRAQFVRLDPADAAALVLRATVTHVSPETAVSDGEVLDDRGRLIARISTRCGLVDQPMPSWTGPSPVRTPGRPPPGSGEQGGALAAVAEHYLDARVASAEQGRVVLSAVAGPTVANARGHVQGGVLGLLAEQAITFGLLRASPRLAAADAVDLDLTFVRSAGPDGHGLTAEARVEHAGRRFAVARAEVRDATGRTVLYASGSRYAS